MQLARPPLTDSPDERDLERAPLKSRRRLRFYATLAAIDTLAIVAGFMLANLIRFGDLVHSQAWTILAVLMPVFWGLTFNGKSYSEEVLVDWRRGVSSVLTSLYAAIATVLFIGFYLKSSTDISRLLVANGIVISTMLLVSGRVVMGRFAMRAFGGASSSRVLIVDGVECASPPDVHRVVADRHGLSPEATDPLTLDRLGRYLNGVDSVVVSCRPERRAAWAMALKGANIHGELTVPELDDIGGIGATRFAGTATMLVSSGPLGFRDQLAKRALDLAIVMAALLFLAPLLLIVAIVIRLDSKGPIFFRQPRVGCGNRLFSVYKFRSMRVEDCDSSGVQSTARDDSRITRVGRFIRKTSIDELPQLINILLGEMSFVGPRPHALGSLAGDQLFWEVDARYWHRHACKPGLTGLAQIRGFRGATHKREDLINRLQADLEYLNGWSVFRDISIILATVKVVVHRNAF